MQLLDVKHVAAMIQVHPATIRRWRAEGNFPAPIQIGRLIRWKEPDVDSWIEEKDEVVAPTGERGNNGDI